MTSDDGYWAATAAILHELAKNGAQRTAEITAWVTAHSLDGPEWMASMIERGLIVPIFGNGLDDPHARWAVSVERAVEAARADSN